MFSSVNTVLICFAAIVIHFATCSIDVPQPPSLKIYTPPPSDSSPGYPDYTDVIVMRVNDNLTLVCELQGDATPRVYVWNYVGKQEKAQYQVDTSGPAARSTLTKHALTLADSGYYMCSAPPFSVTKYILVQTRVLSPHSPRVAPLSRQRPQRPPAASGHICPGCARSTLTEQAPRLADSGHYMYSALTVCVSKYILVQTRGPQHCTRGAFWCGTSCVLAQYVCDGFKDCRNNEDEAPELCDSQPCNRPDKLNCSTGRCVSEAACCRVRGPLCNQPACCDEHPRYSKLEGLLDAEYPPLFEDRHAPDDYGFIQSTIYTVTACALIFMIAVVLLVSAICKMHMKRAALRSYTRAHHHTSQHYSVHYAQAHRFPPCYEASRLLEQERNNPSSPLHSPVGSPARQPLQCSTDCPPDANTPETAEPPAEECGNTGFGLARLSAIFTSRYRQVPTQCLDVEMTDVRPASLQSSPTRNRTHAPLDNYRSPTYCDLNADFIFTNDNTPNCGRDLNYMATPVEFYRRRTLRGNIDRVLDNINRPRPLTLQLGRFQLSIPRLGRRASLDRRPDTPNVAELNIDDLDFVRLNSNDTYTLNGRTIRLLGANFENYPILNDTGTRPPPYTEAMRYKLYGPPPEYLSRDGLNTTTNNTPELQARTNIEMPPNYEELASGGQNNASNANVNDSVNDNASNGANSVNDNINGNVINGNANRASVSDNASVINGNANDSNAIENTVNSNNNNASDSNVTSNVNAINNATDTQITAEINASNGNEDVPLSNGMETLNSVIDNLPAIDSDVNANDSDICV